MHIFPAARPTKAKLRNLFIFLIALPFARFCGACAQRLHAKCAKSTNRKIVGPLPSPVPPPRSLPSPGACQKFRWVRQFGDRGPETYMGTGVPAFLPGNLIKTKCTSCMVSGGKTIEKSSPILFQKQTMTESTNRHDTHFHVQLLLVFYF